MGWFGALFARVIVAQQAFIEELGSQLIIMKNGGLIKSDNWNPQAGTGWMIDYQGNAYFNTGKIGGVKIDADSILVRGKGYLPIGFVYFQLKGQPAPEEIFAGTWENISAQYAGLFFRVEGGNASAFGSGSQGMMIESHTHTYREALGGQSSFKEGDSYNNFLERVILSNKNTEPTGGTETRPVNTTIRVWIRRS
jgi:hypothetical protein